QMKIMNSEWFHDLSLETKGFFFLDLLTVTLSGDIARQKQILQSEQLGELPSSKRANLWRMVGVDAMRNGGYTSRGRCFSQQSVKLNPADRKTNALLRCLPAGRWVSMSFVSLWYLLLKIRKKMSSIGDSRVSRLQKLLGLK